jgi:HEAT repeat protein
MKANGWIVLAFLLCVCAGCAKQDPLTSGGRTASYWAEVLQTPNPDVELRRKAATKLGPLLQLDDAAVPALLQALHDKDSTVRSLAARGLGIYSGPRGEEVLPALLEVSKQDRDKKVREAAAKAVEKLSHPS